MKRIIGMVALLQLSLFSYAQDIQQKNVPAVVLNAFQLKFPNATEINWKLEKGNYRIGFETNNKDNELLLNDKGSVLKLQQDLYVSEIPKIVLETIQAKVAFFDVRDADRIEERGIISYEIELKINEKNHEFRIDELGKLLKYSKELRNSELPDAVINAAKAAYIGYEIRDAVLTEEGGQVIYNLEMRKSKEKMTVAFSKDGKILGVKKN